MIHISSIVIVNGKSYTQKFKNKFLKDQDELKAFLTDKEIEFTKKHYPDGIPEQFKNSYNPFITVESTRVTIPDREFLYYLVKELKFKTIPLKIIELVKGL